MIQAGYRKIQTEYPTNTRKGRARGLMFIAILICIIANRLLYVIIII